MEEISQRITEFQQRGILCGYKRLAESIALEDAPPPYSALYKLTHPNPSHHEPAIDHSNAFVAKFADYLWHTDLDQIVYHHDETSDAVTLYLIAFLDDASREIMYFEILWEKTPNSAAAALRNAFHCWAPPYVLTSNNGGEFLGEAFQAVMRENRTQVWPLDRITRSKMAKWSFWGTIEFYRGNKFSYQVIRDIIDEYNTKWHRRSLGCTPEVARERLPHWRNPEIVIQSDIHANLLWGTRNPFERE